jgi:hypothetical protein
MLKSLHFGISEPRSGSASNRDIIFGIMFLLTVMPTPFVASELHDIYMYIIHIHHEGLFSFIQSRRFFYILTIFVERDAMPVAKLFITHFFKHLPSCYPGGRSCSSSGWRLSLGRTY